MTPHLFRVALFGFALFAANACSSSREIEDAATPINDGSVNDSSFDGSTLDMNADVRIDANVRVVCLGQECAAGEECCFGTGQCVGGWDAGACPPALADSGFGFTPCTANSQCRADEYCASGFGPPRCGGAGICVGGRSAADCAGEPTEPVCGCDGVSYPNGCEVARAGVRPAPGSVDCGDEIPIAPGRRPYTACGRDDQCGTGELCCAYYGLCMDADCPECCQPPAEGTSMPCHTDDDCIEASAFCDGPPGCGNIEGAGCRYPEGCGAGGGILDPVCGCDGVNYTSGCQARANGTRVATSGVCADGGV